MATYHAPARTYPARRGRERPQLEAWLDFYRSTLLVKCDGLTDEQLKRRPVPSSTLSLLGLVRHLTFVEQLWFERVFAGLETTQYFKREDDHDADFHDLDDPPVEDVLALYDVAVATSRERALGHDLDEVAAIERRGQPTDLRWIYVHLIEEYARHVGHADLLRELIDGTVGY